MLKHTIVYHFLFLLRLPCRRYISYLMSECGGSEICDEWLCMARKDKYSVTWRNKLLNWENRPQDDDILWEAFPQCYESGCAVSVVSIEIIFALRLVDIRYNTSIMHTVQTLLCFVVVCCWSIVHISWWRHQMETSSASLAFCAGNSPHKGQWREPLIFFCSVPGPTVEQTMETPVIWDVIALIITSL